MKERRVRNLILSGALSLGSLTGCSYPQCTTLKEPHQQTPRPLVVGYEGWWGDGFHKFLPQVRDRYHVDIDYASVHYWKTTICPIERAYADGRPIIFMAHSAGADQSRLAAKELNKKNIPIEALIWFDPTYTNYSDLKIPENVKAVYPHFSSYGGIMKWARGKPKKFEVDSINCGKTKIYPSEFLPTDHIHMVNMTFLERELDSLFLGVEKD